MENKISLSLTHNELWVLVKALIDFTDAPNVERFMKEYPDCDMDAIEADVNALIEKIKAAQKKS